MKRFTFFTGLSLLGLAGFVGQWGYDARVGIDPRVHDRYAQDIRSLQALDARLNEQVLQSRQSLVTHYDDLARSMATVRATLSRLQPPPRFLTEAYVGELGTALTEAQTLQEDKARLVERFKGQNAVFRNSARYFPVAAQELRTKLGEEPDGKAATALVDDVLVTVLQYVQLPSVPQLERAQKALDVLTTAPMPGGPSADRDIVLLHAKVLLDRSAKVAELTNTILKVPIPTGLERLEDRYEAAIRDASSRADRRRELMFLTALLMVLALAIDFVQRFRRAAQFERLTASQLAAANETLQREKDGERELSDLKNRFISMTSHEFRTPLSVILSSTELLEAYGDRWQPTKRSDHYNRIKSAVSTMRELLDAVLVIGKSDAGRLECNPAPIDLERFVRDCVEAIASTSMRHEFRLNISFPLPEATIDERLAIHVLTNLLSNAVKYAPAGGPIDIGVKAIGEMLEIKVRDRGIGITKEDQLRLFESFHRGKNVGTIAGTGLGLAVVKRAVTAHAGSVMVVSAEGEGSTFTVCLPAFAPEDPQAAPTEAEPDTTEAEPDTTEGAPTNDLPLTEDEGAGG